MALFGSFGSAISSALGGFSSGGLLGSLTGIGSSLLRSAIAPRPAPVVRPSPAAFIGPQLPQLPAVAVGPTPMVTMAAAPIIPMVARATAQLVAPILAKIATTLGRNTLSVKQVTVMIRKMGRFLEPAAIGAALGITGGELAQIIMAASQIRPRRTNPANISALRRALRRVESFHRICQKADVIAGRRRSRRSKPAHPAGVQIVRGG